MPLTRSLVDGLGLVTICLVAILVLVGLFCILYLFYFRSRIRRQGFTQLDYFNGPWAIRVLFILFSIWWGFGEIVRLSLLRQERRLMNALHLKWQENICKYYTVSNLGFAEPCMFLTIVFLLRASLQKSGTLRRKWNGKTAGCIVLFCIPMFALQLVVVLVAPQFDKENYVHKLPHYFLNTVSASKIKEDVVVLCTSPLLSTIFLGLFATILTMYIVWLGRRILHVVINKGLQRRVCVLIVSVSGFFLTRVLLLGLSVLSEPGHVLFEILVFLSFLCLLCCAGMGICMLVYFPVADSLSLRNLLEDVEARRLISSELSGVISLTAGQSPLGESIESSPRRSSAASSKDGSISFRVEKDETFQGTFMELGLFSYGEYSSPPGSPRLGWPVRPSVEFGHGP